MHFSPFLLPSTAKNPGYYKTNIRKLKGGEKSDWLVTWKDKAVSSMSFLSISYFSDGVARDTGNPEMPVGSDKKSLYSLDKEPGKPEPSKGESI